MKKLIAILMPLFMLLLLLTACSSGSDTSSAEKEEGASGEAAHDELVDGSWEATSAMVATDQKGDIVLNLDPSGSFTENVFYADSEGNVTDTENPTITYSGTFKTDGDKLTLEATEKTENGEKKEITDLSAEMPVGEFTYTVSGDSLQLQNETTHDLYDYVKI